MLSVTRAPISLLSFASLVSLGACSPTSPTPDTHEPETQQPDTNQPASEIEPSTPPLVVEADAHANDEPLDPRFVPVLQAAAKDYRGWGRVDERPNIAPALCRAPMGLDFGFPSHARLSQADDAEHGKKLYYLFAGIIGDAASSSARERYTALGQPAAGQPTPDPTLPIGFTVVKQSWVASAKPAAAAAPVIVDPTLVSFDPPAPISWVEHEGQRLHVGEQAELFVMTKVGAADMPGTDAGWIYGTLTPDGQRVTSAGQVSRCMDCHEAATHERLFGLQTTKAFAKVQPSPSNAEPELPRELGVVR